MSKFILSMTIDKTFNSIEDARAEASSLAFINSKDVFILKVAEKAMVQTVIVSLEDNDVQAPAPIQPEKKVTGTRKKTLIEKSQELPQTEFVKEVLENSIQKNYDEEKTEILPVEKEEISIAVSEEKETPADDLIIEQPSEALPENTELSTAEKIKEDPALKAQIEQIFGSETTGTKDSLLDQALREISDADSPGMLKLLSQKYFHKYSANPIYSTAYENKVKEFETNLFNEFLNEIKALDSKEAIAALADSKKYKVLEMSGVSEKFKSIKEDNLFNISIINLVNELNTSVKSTKELNSLMEKYSDEIKEDSRVKEALTNVLKKIDPTGITLTSKVIAATESKKIFTWDEVKSTVLGHIDKAGARSILNAVISNFKIKHPHLAGNTDLNKAYFEKFHSLPVEKEIKKAGSDPD